MDPDRAAPKRRLFFALWPDARVAAALDAAGRRAHRDCGGRRTALDSIHLTLAFLGEIPAERAADAEATAAAVRGESFVLRIDRLGWWKHNRILWAGCDPMPPALESLAADLGRRLRDAGFALEARPFAAHVTLLRNARCPAPPQLPEAIDWPVREFVLVESRLGEEIRYPIIGRWPLSASA